ARGDARLAFLGRNLHPVHLVGLVAHPAIADRVAGFGDVFDNFRGTVQLADAAAELALFLVGGLAADMFAEVIIGAGIVLPADEHDLALHGGDDLIPGGDGAAFSPDFTKLFDGNAG